MPDETQAPASEQTPKQAPAPRTLMQELSDTLAEYGKVQFNLKRFRRQEIELEARIVELNTQIMAEVK